MNLPRNLILLGRVLVYGQLRKLTSRVGPLETAVDTSRFNLTERVVLDFVEDELHPYVGFPCGDWVICLQTLPCLACSAISRPWRCTAWKPNCLERCKRIARAWTVCWPW